jgi:hypothetical protein
MKTRETNQREDGMDANKETCDAIRKLMALYSEKRAAWVSWFGTADGFDAWFTQLVMPAKK